MKKQIGQFFEQFKRHDLFTRSAAVAYYTALSISPLVLLLIFGLGSLNLDLTERMLYEVNNLIGPESERVLRTIVNASHKTPDLKSFSGWAGTLALLGSASVLFAELQNSLNVIFNADMSRVVKRSQKESWSKLLTRRLLSIGLVLTFVFIAIVSLVVSTSLSYLLSGVSESFLMIVNLVVNFIVFTFLFSVIFKWTPDRPVLFSQSLLGGSLTAFLFLAGKSLISIYIGQTAVGSAFGAAGSLVVFLVWVYYSALVFFLGAEISSFILHSQEKEIYESKVKAA